MKFLILLVTLAMLFYSCQSKYTYIEDDGDETIIKASSDSVAYLQAFQKFEISKKSYQHIKEAYGSSMLKEPISFKLINNKGEDITHKVFFANKDSLEKDIVERINNLPNNARTKSGEIGNKKHDAKVDSFTLAEQKKAIGEIQFGISEKEFQKQKEEFESKTKSEYSYALGKYEFWGVYGAFDNDSLYYLYLRGRYIGYDDYDIEMPTQYYSLMEILETKYGEPIIKPGLPSWTSIDKGYFKTCAKWDIGDKTVEVRIVCEGVDYHMDLVTFKPQVLNKIEKEEIDKSKNTNRKAAEML